MRHFLELGTEVQFKTLYIIRVFSAILALQTQYSHWPDSDERAQLAKDSLNEMPNCIGYVDGTEVKLAERPENDPDSYLSRKQIHSLKVQITCDRNLMIGHIVLGYPGSVHDSGIFNNCPSSVNPAQFFSGDQYILGDSAYKISPTVITPYRVNNTKEETVQARNSFNRTLGKYRVRIENCIGLLKERFNCLKELKVLINNNESVRFACNWILVCGILHNIIQQNNEADCLEDFHNEEFLDTMSDDHCTQVLDPNTTAGEAKRNALMEYLYSLMD